MILFSADQHYNHKNIIKYCKRPFKTVEEMNETMIANHNSIVSKNDLIYYLGDFALGNDINSCKKILERLNGRKMLIKGSHDKTVLQCSEYFEKISSLMEINIDGIPITLCHYCMRVWSKSHYNSFMLYAHSHGTLNPIGKSEDVGVDNNNFYPVSWNKIKEIMKNRPDNFNYIKKRK